MSFLRDIWEIIFFSGIICIVSFVFLFRRSMEIKPYYPTKNPVLIAKAILRISIVGLLLFALAGPHLSEKSSQIETQTTKRDFLIALDLSHSMLANDLKPSRLERAKLYIKQLNQKLEGNNFGIVVFSSNAFVQCPLTYDKEYFKKMISFCHPNLVPNKGTNLVVALEKCLDRLTHRDQVDAKSKVIILVSDGEDFGDEMIPMAEKIKQENIKVFCVGIGTETGGNIKLQNGLKRDYQGNIVNTKLNRSSLKKLASVTGGEYFELSDTRYELTELINSLKTIKGNSSVSDNKIAPKESYYHIFLFLALALLIIDFIIKPRVLDI